MRYVLDACQLKAGGGFHRVRKSSTEGSLNFLAHLIFYFLPSSSDEKNLSPHTREVAGCAIRSYIRGFGKEIILEVRIRYIAMTTRRRHRVPVARDSYRGARTQSSC